jgi:hypothetical protein
MDFRKIKIIIASPSDVNMERELLLNSLETKFRRENFEDLCKARIIVEGWEYLPSQTGYAQDIINSELIRKADIVIAVFRHRLGSPTINIKTGQLRSSSGTAEELMYAINKNRNNNKPVGMAYFYGKPPKFSLFSFRARKEWKRLETFKKEISHQMIYKIYNDPDHVLDIACKDICQNIMNHPVLVGN